MNAWPVIAREMREQARRRFTYVLRVLGVAATLAALALVFLNGAFLPGWGDQVLVRLHDVLLFAIWILVPLSAADCISQERREGTLSLLFLTPLKARDIVLAKALAHGLRALTLWLSVLPVLVIPFLIGGLSWRSVALSCAINLSSLALALGAGVLASSLCRDWRRSLALTMSLACLVAAGFGVVLVFGLTAALQPFIPAIGWQETVWEELPALEEFFTAAFALMTGADEIWTNGLLGNLPPPAQRALMLGVGGVTAFSLLAAGAMLLLAAWNVRRRWRDQSRSARMEKLKRVFCTPMLWQSLLRRWMKWKMERNPIGWLEQRTWSGRLVMWTWLAVLVSFYSAVFSGNGIYQRNFQESQTFLAWLLLVSVAATAAGSFRRERESGVLELLLVAPLNSWQIISGRVRGMWAQFAPAVGLLLGVWVFTATFSPRVRAWDGVWFAVAFLTMPVIGLYYSLAKTHFLSSFLWTLLMGWVFPALLANPRGLQRLLLLYVTRAVPLGGTWRDSPLVRNFLWCSIQIMFALVFAWMLRRNLEQRRFALERKPV